MSGGSGGAPVPGLNDMAIFDSSGIGPCTFDIPVQTKSMNLSSYGIFFGDCTTTDLYLNSGYIFAGDSDTTVHVLGNVYGSSSYGAWNPNNNLPIVFNGDSTQHLYNESGCILPSIVIG
jgi:hypothetical protein